MHRNLSSAYNSRPLATGLVSGPVYCR